MAGLNNVGRVECAEAVPSGLRNVPPPRLCGIETGKAENFKVGCWACYTVPAVAYNADAFATVMGEINTYLKELGIAE